MKIVINCLLALLTAASSGCNRTAPEIEPPIPPDGRMVVLEYSRLYVKNQKLRAQEIGGLVRWDETWITLKREDGTLFALPADEIISVSEGE